ncbi:sensory transduction histidine kinase [Synechocystis sp. PCC 6803]|uniref:histidine kinase n=1 Tax=Synechocystis sp. (strain ATCC 27184 / PCC 6803 / Kazusa) TaxID=1111708 RepID=Q55783_SYNY3|nr:MULTISPECIES: HAMP domain-containing sensor histidine kinase [unclassified Synechocystis]AGF52726.1 sensory transduction histidine kinase [Synechocystis sp. PCC 6803]ALJ68644.1 histidine kinase [Synechocystis sp. PCC 6803]AVP90495.1 sensor histidine kinase [Synechocystis sp. IPPAS B-1465]MBD2616760.1 HAMP domain-containing histidine kinase [Synechocystis sp. FACHB-898]MBD2638074.1 HAMP domain-containing histidine kinase [Synechocystis sp. FACHB-908]
MGSNFPNRKSLQTAGDGFEQSIARLIASMIPVQEIYYWRLGASPETPEIIEIIPTLSMAFQTGHSPWPMAEKCLKFIGDRQGDLQRGKSLLTDLKQHWQEITSASFDSGAVQANTNDDLPYFFLPVFQQNQYVGGICLVWPHSQWRLEQYLFLQEVGNVFTYQYHGESETISPQKSFNGGDRHTSMTINLSHIHHEFRTPLTAIIGFARMLRDELYGKLNPKQHQYVQGTLNSAEHLLSLVNDFLDLSKIDARCEELFYEQVAVEDLCLAVISMVQTKAKEKQLALNLTIDDGVDFCYVDQRRWKQILINLLSNGVKFTPKGSVTLAVKATDKALIFSVIDTGIGIDPEDQRDLFQPFKQISHPPSFAEKGTGLGLALSRRLAQLHGGDIQLTSTPGVGSCFSAILPLKTSVKNYQT